MTSLIIWVYEFVFPFLVQQLIRTIVEKQESWTFLGHSFLGDQTVKCSLILSSFGPVYYQIGLVDVLRLAEIAIVQKSLTGSILFILHFLFFSSREDRARDLNSERKLTWMILQIKWPSYHLTSSKKSSFIQKSSSQVPKAFSKHGIAEKTKII